MSVVVMDNDFGNCGRHYQDLPAYNKVKIRHTVEKHKVNHDKYNGKLTMMHAVRIRRYYKDGLSIDNISKKYNVCSLTISNIIHFVTYKPSYLKRINKNVANEIRFKFSTGKFTKLELSKEYKISQRSVYRILNNEIYS